MQGATPAQARAALKKYKDLMQAAEKFFDGEFADVMDDDAAEPDGPSRGAIRADSSRRMMVCLPFPASNVLLSMILDARRGRRQHGH